MSGMNRTKVLWASIAGLADPLLNKLARQLAATVPEGSPIRGRTAELAMGVVKGFIEAAADAWSVPIATLVEKVTDFGDFFSGALGTSTAEQRRTAIDPWMASFIEEAKARLGASKEPLQELEELQRELTLRIELIKQLGEEPRATGGAHAAGTTATTWAAKALLEMGKALKVKNDRMEQRLGNRRTQRFLKRKQRQQTCN